MSGALAYLLLTSARNQVRTRVTRLRNPRYAIALVVGLAYIWLVYLRPAHRDAANVDMLGGPVIPLLPLFLLGYVAWTWLFGSDRNALAFSQAEVTMLFTAPVSRRALLLYKLSRTQLRIITTSIVWTLVLRRSPTAATAMTHFVGYWVLLSALNLNRLGVAMIQASGADHGLRGARRHWRSIAVVVVALGMVLVPAVRAWPAMRSAVNVPDAADALAAAIGAAPARWALWPFRALLALVATPPGLAWLAALGPALLLLGGLAWWVLRTDTAFEEAAAEASAHQARRIEALRARRIGGSIAVPRKSRTIPLAPTGPPAVALFWKNAMWLLRTNQLRALLLPPAAALGLVLVLGTRSPAAAIGLAIAPSILAVAMLIFAPMAMRNDLRSELLHLSLLKTFPLRGRDVVLAEVASSALPLAMMQYLLGLVALFSVGLASVAALPADVRLALALGSPLLLVALNIAVLMIHNALALLFPGWVRLGPSTSGGVEALGLGMITITFALVMLGVMLVIPGLVATIVVSLLRDRLPVALFAGGLVAGALLLAEGVGAAWALGGSLDRVEPMQVG